MTKLFPSHDLGDLNPHGFRNMVEPFERACAEFAGRTAFSCLGHNTSFAELEQASRAFGAYLLNDAGLNKGDRIAIQLPNITQYPIAVWGALRAGLIVVNTNPLYTAREQTHQFNDSGALALVVFEDLLPVTKTVLEQTGIETVITSAMQAGGEFTSFAEALSNGAESSLPELDADMNDLAVLQYTGGTTGPSKGAMLSHGNLFAGVEMGRQSVEILQPGDVEISLAPLPLYHVFGFTQHVTGTVIYGGHSILIPNPRDMASFIGAMQSEPFTHLNAVNTLLQGIMAHPDFDQIDFSNFNSTIAGGTALVKEIAIAWEEKTGARIFEGYGLSETTAGGFCNRPESSELGTVGPALNYQEVKLIDDAGQEVGPDEAGEICLRGPNVMHGYWQRDEATAETIDDQGWMKTGDIGVIQSNGHLRIVDRIKDMILVSGFNVYPNEVEEVVYSHSDIVECGAIGVPNEATGEAVKLFVVSKNPDLSADEIIAHCRNDLVAYKVPKQVVFQDDLPKSPAGKVLRRELREL